jgi:methylmalonyl-CoA mutase C-terminal domain/subunit
MPAVVDLLRAKDAGEIVVIGGGIIPQDDVPTLKKAGIAEVFLPGSPTTAIVEWIKANVRPGAAAA